jgi:transposase InsO family protein
MGEEEEPFEEPESRERMTEAQRRITARRLEMAYGTDRHLAARLAFGYDVTPHWLRALRRRLERGETKKARGRPRLATEERVRIRALVVEQLTIQGLTAGWRPVLQALLEAEVATGVPRKLSVALVQEETADLKRTARTRKRRALEETREGHEVLARDAVWAEDATHVGRLLDTSEVQAEVASDRASTSTVIAAVGPPATGEDIRSHLERARVERGTLPYVWQSDPGSANTSAWLAAYFEENLVIHLCSRVHTPQDNPAAENKNREIKEESGLGKGVVLESPEEAAARLEPARRRLDEGRLRASRGWKTAAELDRELPRAEDLVPRATFYAETRSAMREAVLGLVDPRAIRKAEQDAIWRTLEKHGLARRHVGPRRTPCPRLAPVAPGANG